jgi:ABC-type glycerol-3-phosphate transport system substrate-binding protein
MKNTVKLLFVAFVMAATLVACGGGAKTEEAKDTTTAAAPDTTVTVAPDTTVAADTAK